jgi:hypothetical protein
MGGGGGGGGDTNKLSTGLSVLEKTKKTITGNERGGGGGEKTGTLKGTTTGSTQTSKGPKQQSL